MCGVLRSEECEVLSIEADSIEMNEVRITPLFLPDAAEVQEPVLLIDPDQLRNVPLTRRNLILQPPRLQIVEIALPPVVTFSKPDHLVRGWKKRPVVRIISRLVIRRNLPFDDVADLARFRVGDAQARFL